MAQRHSRPSTTTVAGGDITVFEDEELLHDIRPSFLGSLSKLDWVLTVTLVWLPVPYLKWRHTRFVITDTRIIDVQGSLTGKSTVETYYDDIAGDVRTSQGLIGGLLNRGTIEFEIERERGTTATEREFGDRDGSSREMNIVRESVELQGIREYREVSNTIRRIRNE